MKHQCHAHNCKTLVPPKMLMCLKHWKMVPKNIQVLIWRHYVPGQEVTKDPTNDYLKAQQLAIASVIVAESGLSIEDAVKALEEE